MPQSVCSARQSASLSHFGGAGTRQSHPIAPELDVPLSEYINIVIAAGGVLVGALAVYVPLAYDARKTRRELRLNHRREMNEKYRAAYQQNQQNYFVFLQNAVQYPHLGLRATDEDTPGLSPLEETRRSALYEMLFSIFERAYLDRDLTPEIRDHQWPGWEEYIRAYFQKPSVLAEWNGQDSYGLDRRFEKFIREEILPSSKGA